MSQAETAPGYTGPIAPEVDPRARRKLERIEGFAWWMDEAFQVPGTRWRVGLDGLLGLIFGVGDTATFLLGGYVLYEARQLGAPRSLLARMLGNLLVDYAVGLVPLVGDLADFRIKAHRRNARLLREWLERAPD